MRLLRRLFVGGSASRAAACLGVSVAWGGAAHAAGLVVTVLDAAGQPLADAVVAVTVAGHPAKPGAPVDMVQRGRAFVPTLLVISTGTEVRFPNEDKVRHQVYSFSPTKPFELKLYGAGEVPSVVFDQPGTVVLGCNIHDRMIGFIHVVDTPFTARTDRQGRAELDLPPGQHRLQLWHAQLGDAAPPAPMPLSLPAAGTALRLSLPAGSGR